MKYQAAGAILALVLAAACVGGCGSGSDRNAVEVEIREEQTQLGTWREELEQDTTDSEILAESIRGMSVQKDGEEVFAVSYEPRDYKESYDYWSISIPYQSMPSVNTEALYQLFETVESLGNAEPCEVSLENAGIAGTGSSIYLAYDGDQEEEQKGQPQPTTGKILLIGKEDGQGHYYVAVDGNEQVCLAGKDVVEQILQADPYQYILKIPVLVSLNSIDRVSVSYGDTTHVLEKDGYRIDGEEAGQERFQEYYGTLLDIPLTGVAEESSKEEKEPVLVIRYDRTDEEATDIEVCFYPYDEDNLSASVNGCEAFLADREAVEAVMGSDPLRETAGSR